MANVNVPPQPGLLKTMGVFNLLFGGLLLLCGLGCLRPALQGLAENASLSFDPAMAQQILDADRDARISELQQAEQQAATAEEKAKLKQARLKVEANHPRVEDKLDFGAINEGFRWTTRTFLADAITGAFLNLFLLISGLGLIVRKNWARVLGIATSALKIIRLVALCILLMAFTVPKLSRSIDILAGSEFGRELYEHGVEQNQAANGGAAPGPVPGPKEIAEYLRAFGNIYAILLPCLGSIYPAVALMLLSRPGARAACFQRDDEGPWEGPTQ